MLVIESKYEPSTPRGVVERAHEVRWTSALRRPKRSVDPNPPLATFIKVLPIYGKYLFSIVIKSIFVYNFINYVHLKESKNDFGILIK